MLKHQYTRVECNFVTSLVLDSKSDKFKTLQIPFFKSAKFVPANISHYTVRTYVLMPDWHVYLIQRDVEEVRLDDVVEEFCILEHTSCCRELVKVSL